VHPPFEIEAREFLRVAVRVPVLFRLYEKADTWGGPREGLTENLSVGGLLLHARLPEADLLSRAVLGHAPAAIEFPLPDGYPEPVRGIARVAWVETVRGKPEECRLGVRFLEMLARDRDRIVEFVVRACL
jgi:hypothetical protein